MIIIRKSADRGHFNHGWLDTYHTFSFGDYHDPSHMGFRSLRVINEDIVRHGRGFGMHPHRDMEIITCILSGSLAHKDSTGHSETLRPGEVQRMSAGRGIMHSEVNPSPTEPVHLLQIWIEPDVQGIEPEYDQRQIPPPGPHGLSAIASPDGAGGSMKIHADARLYAGNLEAGERASLAISASRHAWVQVARGTLTLNGIGLAAGDGAALSQETSLDIAATSASQFLIFDLA